MTRLVEQLPRVTGACGALAGGCLTRLRTGHEIVAMGEVKRFEYQRQDTTKTLREGLEEYYRGHPDLIRPESLEGESAALFRSHDVCHVVFGLDTDLVDETLADTWTLLGATITPREYLAYIKQPEVRQLLKEIGMSQLVLGVGRALPKVLHVWKRSRRMRRKWPWKDFQANLDRPLKAIREDFGIELV